MRRRGLPWRCAMFLCGSGLLAAQAVAQAPLSLFNGMSLMGWTVRGPWSASGGALTSNASGDRLVQTLVPFADNRLEFEYFESGSVGARLRLWASREGRGGLSIDLDQSGSAAGVGGIETLSHSSIGSVSPGWHKVQVEAANGGVSVRVDGQPSGSAFGLGARAGYIGFQVTQPGTLQVRNIRLTPLNLDSLFNGADLSGWKSVAQAPEGKSGMGRTMERTLTFGLGGNSKPHEARWTVRGGSIHGESGPGGLENTSPVQDGIFQISASVTGEPKPENYTALALRNVPGQIGGGYAVGIGPFAGGIEKVVAHVPQRTSAPVDQTVVIGGRSIEIWTSGSITTAHTDTRPEASNTATGAKTAAGSVALLLPHGSGVLDVQRVKFASLPKTFGIAARAVPPPPTPPTPAVAPTPANAAATPSEAEKALLAQGAENSRKEAADQANKQRVAGLMGQALATTDPQQQMAAYGQVVQIDPSNAAAVQGFKEAQGRLQAQQAAAQQAVATQQTQQQQQVTRDEQVQSSLHRSQGAFLNGHLSEASSALSVAERLSPTNPLIRDLRTRISSAQAVRSRLMFLGGGMGVLATAGLIAAWLRRRKQQRHPVLEVTRGVEQGKTFALDKDLVRIGAVAQNGAQKNDIVIQDTEHAISRFHCEIARKNGQLYVTDLKSSNGTRLNGTTLRPGQPELLRRGSTITLAENVDLRFGYDRSAAKKS